jgi:hypothetical protein
VISWLRIVPSCAPWRLTDTAASFIGLAYIVFFRFVGLALLLWMAGKAALGAGSSCITKGESCITKTSAPTIG